VGFTTLVKIRSHDSSSSAYVDVNDVDVSLTMSEIVSLLLHIG